MSGSETTETETTTTAAAEDVGPEDVAKAERKRARHRKKKLFEKILKQMEFYFSDANLTKDRFLGELTRIDPAVPLDVFLKFNKIRALTHNISDIAKAIEGSKLLQCTDNNTKVQRIIPLEPYDAETRTIYVESVPVTVDRDWLESVFSEYGSVAYISLPKFKNTNRNKGFAFIEFDNPQDTQKCLTAFTKMGRKLPTGMAPEELTTVKTFSADNSTEKPTDVDHSTEKAIDESSADESKLNSSREERKRPAEKRKSGEEPPKKKQKKKSRKKKENVEQGANLANNENIPVEDDVPNYSGEESKAKDVETEASCQEDAVVEGQPVKKKCRKRTAKERNKAKNKTVKSGLPPGAVLGLQVLSKMEWRVLRNKYLNLQRKQMKELKNSLRMQGLYQAPAQTGAEDHMDKGEEKKASEAAALSKLHRVEGVFVKVTLEEPCLDVRLTKREVRSNVHVQHVDIKEGQCDMMIRFDTPQSAEQYCSSGIYSSARVLLGAESTEEWDRVSEARASRGPARRPRGRTRLLERAAAAAKNKQDSPAALPTSGYEPTTSHIRFDD